MLDKEKYIKRVFKSYKDNKRRLRELSFDEVRAVDYSKTRSTSGAPKGTEEALVSYIDEKRKLEKQVDIVERTLEYYRIDEKAKCSGYANIIRWRYIKGYSYNRAIIECNLPESTMNFAIRGIMETAAAIADIYSLWTE